MSNEEDLEYLYGLKLHRMSDKELRDLISQIEAAIIARKKRPRYWQP